MRNTSLLKDILDLMSEYKSLKLKSAKKELIKVLKKFDISLVSYEVNKNYLFNIKVKLNRHFSVPTVMGRKFPHLEGKIFNLKAFLDHSKHFMDIPDYGYNDVTRWNEDLTYALKTWLITHGNDIQALVGDIESYPKKKKYYSIVKRKFQRYGWKGALLIKMGLGLFGALFWKLAFQLIDSSIEDNPLLDLSKDSLETFRRVGSSQASWAILSSGVSQARVEAHIIRLTVNQLLNSLEKSPLKEDFYKHVGDNLQALPAHLSKLERNLDRTNYSLITMGSDWYRQRLVHEDREMVDMASKFNPLPVPSTIKKSHLKQANQFKRVLKEFIYGKTEYLIDEIKRLKQHVPYNERHKVQQELEKELAQHKEVFIKSAYEELKKKLKGFHYELVRFEPTPKVYSNMTIKKKNGVTTKTLVTLETEMRRRAKEEELSDNPQSRFKDLLFVIEEWKYKYGYSIQLLVGEEPLSFKKHERTIVARLQRFLKIKTVKAKLLIKAIGLFFDSSAVNGLLTFLILPLTLNIKIPTIVYAGSLLYGVISLLVTGKKNADPTLLRIKRIFD